MYGIEWKCFFSVTKSFLIGLHKVLLAAVLKSNINLPEALISQA